MRAAAVAWVHAALVAIALLGATTLVRSAIVPDTGKSSRLSDLAVKLKVDIAENLATVTCQVAGIDGPVDDNKIQVFCPVLRDSQCFGDCSPMCSMQADGDCRVSDPVLQQPHVHCTRSTPGPGIKVIELKIDTSRLAGNWYCKFRGRSSAEVTLNRYAPSPAPAATAAPMATAASTTASRQQQQTQPTVKVVMPDHATRRSPSPGSTASPANPSDIAGGGGPDGKGDSKLIDSNLAPFARADFVFGVPALLGVSLIVNLAFCIRCCLAKYYVSLRRRKQEPPGCLASCLCVSTVQVLEKSPAAVEDTYEEVLPRTARSHQHQQQQQQRGSVRTMETTYIEHAGCMQRSRTMPPPAQAAASLYYLQGVSDSMSRILYDDVPPGSRHGSRPSSPYGQLLLSGRHSHSRSSLRGGGGIGGLNKSQAGNSSANSVPAVPEETTPFVEKADEEDDVSRSSDYSGATRLELSRLMLRKADTLLREANSLLRDTAQEAAADGDGGLHAAD